MVMKELLRDNAQRMLNAAKTWLAADHYGVAAYLSGYAAEFQLKARVVEHRNLSGFPSDTSEFRTVEQQKGIWLKTHVLDELLEFSGQRDVIKNDPTTMTVWSACAKWSPGYRYDEIGKVTKPAAEALVRNVEALLGHL